MNQDIIDIILENFPCRKPYKYIDEIVSVDDNHIIGSYTYKKSEYFFKGHFPGFPVVPGAILTETAAQIGLLAFGMFLMAKDVDKEELKKTIKSFESQPLELTNMLFFLVSSNLDYRKVVKPSECVLVRADKMFFRFGKLKCKILMYTPNNILIAKGIISGMTNSKLYAITDLY